jgi:hypothetical protein
MSLHGSHLKLRLLSCVAEHVTDCIKAAELVRLMGKGARENRRLRRTSLVFLSNTMLSLMQMLRLLSDEPWSWIQEDKWPAAAEVVSLAFRWLMVLRERSRQAWHTRGTMRYRWRRSSCLKAWTRNDSHIAGGRLLKGEALGYMALPCT